MRVQLTAPSISHIMQSLQPARDPVTEPGLDGDHLGEGSTQNSLNNDSWGEDRDRPFWEALTTHVKNLHAVVSGHGEFSTILIPFHTP